MACVGAVPLKIITESSKEKSRHLRIEDGEALKPEGIRSLQPKSRSPSEPTRKSQQKSLI